MINHGDSDSDAERTAVEAETVRSLPADPPEEFGPSVSPWVKHDPWTSSTDTSPGVYSDFFSLPEVEDAMASVEPTVEDQPSVGASLAATRRFTSVPEKTPQSSLLHHVCELEESGDYDLRALAPLRQLLEQDWADPNVRSRLQARIEATAPPADVETTKIPTVSPSVLPSSVERPIPAGKPAFIKAPHSPISATDSVSAELVFDDEVKPAPEVSRPVLKATAVTCPSVPLPEKANKPRLRSWIPLLGVIAVGAAWAVPSQWLLGSEPVVPIPVHFVLASEPRADVFQDSERLGQTPLVVEQSQVRGGLVLHREGYQDALFTPEVALTSNKVEKIQVVLKAAPVALDWNGLPQGSELWWQGKPVKVDNLASFLPGSYPLKVQSPGRPPISLSVVIPPPSGDGVTAPVWVGQQVAQALAQQPSLNLTYQVGKSKTTRLPLTVTVTGDNGQGFQETVQLDGKVASRLVLPKPGTYLVKVPASATHLAFRQTLTVKQAGSHQALDIALQPIPPKVVAAPTAPSSGSGGYSPEPYYAPAPTYYRGGAGGGGNGGGGGGGRIAPPSF